MFCEKLIRAGAVGSTIAAICCATPILGIVLGAVGLGAWLARADYVLLPALALFLAMLGYGLHRRRQAVAAICASEHPPEGASR